MPAGLLHEEKEELMSKKKQSINYLDLIPQRAETLRWHTDEQTGLITLEVSRCIPASSSTSRSWNPTTLSGSSTSKKVSGTSGLFRKA